MRGDVLVGIVLVSHSKKMAEGAMEIIQQVIGEKPIIHTAHLIIGWELMHF